MKTPFNKGQSSINMEFSPTNQAWLVWREDHNYQALMRIHNEKRDAQADYFDRVNFLREIGVIK